MYHLHLTRNLRSLAFVLVALAIVAALGTLSRGRIMHGVRPVEQQVSRVRV